MVRSNGVHTYFGADCAYLVDKFSRGFDHLIYVWGADHHGDVARVKGAAQALGYDPDAVEIVIYQWVALRPRRRAVPMGKRSGDFITLDQLLDEVGDDATRFTLLSMFATTSTINFDIEAVKRRSMDNPVYYVQYGHARIASHPAHRGRARGRRCLPIEEVDLSLLATRGRDRPDRSLADVPGRRSGRRRSSGRRTGSRTSRRIWRRGSTASTPSAGSSPRTRPSPRPGCGSATGDEAGDREPARTARCLGARGDGACEDG